MQSSADHVGLSFPAGFLWGTATSPTQIEGHIENEWTDFKARDGGTCRVACDSYHRYPEDIQWMREIGVNAYRMGIEWSRLQKHAYGPLNEMELDRYVDQIDRLTAAGITPMVVLHHFSNPPWINSAGGWTNRRTIPAFVDYVQKLVGRLHNKVRMWNTFNEPDTYACCGFVIGHFPPLLKGRLRAFRRVIQNMAEAHVEVSRLICKMGSNLGKVEVGFSKNWTYFQAHRRFSPWDVFTAAFAHSQFNDYVLNAFLTGSRRNASTFLGVNYYGRIRFQNLKPLLPTCGFSREELLEKGVECDDMLERHPAGLEAALVQMHQRCSLPIYLTEHGSSSADESFRERDLKENLKSLHRAIGRGVNICGFYYWSLLDNFEWQFGYSKKFGLLSVDFANESLPRAMKPLGLVYRRICQRNSLEAIA
jgi:beta-glucosidase